MELKKKVESIEVKEKSISQLLLEMSKTAYQGRKLGEAFEVWEEMIKDPNVTIVMGLAGSMSTAGQWKIINWLIENRFIDVLVSTGANVSEDLVEAMGFSYWQGSPYVDDRNLMQYDINRYYDVYGFDKDYSAMEHLIKSFILTLREDYVYSTMDFLHLFGRWLLKRGIRSIVAVAAEHDVPIFAPAIADSAYGEAFLLAKNEGRTIIVDGVKDFDQFVSIAERVKDIGVIYIGGGVPKDYTQLMAISISPKTRHKGVTGRKAVYRKSIKEYYHPHKYAIQITTDSPQWGGLSGCTLEEAISWGKVDPEGKRVTCYCDATIALPLITHALNERIKFKRKAPNMTWLFEDVLKNHPNH